MAVPRNVRAMCDRADRRVSLGTRVREGVPHALHAVRLDDRRLRTRTQRLRLEIPWVRHLRPEADRHASRTSEAARGPMLLHAERGRLGEGAPSALPTFLPAGRHQRPSPACHRHRRSFRSVHTRPPSCTVSAATRPSRPFSRRTRPLPTATRLAAAAWRPRGTTRPLALRQAKNAPG